MGVSTLGFRDCGLILGLSTAEAVVKVSWPARRPDSTTNRKAARKIEPAKHSHNHDDAGDAAVVA